MNLVTVFTVGHGTRSLEELIEMLSEVRVNVLLDVRTVPKSRTNPQFNKVGSMPALLAEAGITYQHEKRLGGFRKPVKDSFNTAWRASTFRGFADYMQTEDFQRALDMLVNLAHENTVAIMCAELHPRMCHRSLISDALLAIKQVQVQHLLSLGRKTDHTFTLWGRVLDKKVVYDGNGEAEEAVDEAGEEGQHKQATECASESSKRTSREKQPAITEYFTAV